MWIKHPWNISDISNSELTRTLFPVESANNIKITITHHGVIGYGWIWEGISLMIAYWVSQSVTQCSTKILMQSVMVCLKENV